MNAKKLLGQITRTTFYIALVSLANGQLVTQTTTSGREFQLQGRSTFPAVDVPEGRRFRGENRATLVLSGLIHMPAGNAAEHKLIKLVIRFRTGGNGPTLYTVAIGDLKRDLGIKGDFTKQETRNVLNYNGISVDRVPVRLTIGFAGGFDSIIGDQEFVLTRIDASFLVPERRATERIPSSPVISSSGNMNHGPAPSIPLGNVNAVIYTISNTDHLTWSRHEGMGDGTFKWASDTRVVGNGWNFKQVFSAGGGVIYVIAPNGDLLWYHHDGIIDGTFRWSSSQPKTVGSGWNYKQVFPAGGGVIYAINDNGELLWFHHSGQRDGSANWISAEGKVVGTGWNFKRVFSGGGGVIYALTDTGDLLWYRHDGRGDGSQTWAANSGAKVGTGWTVDQIFSSGNGVIYIVNNANDLVWFRHTGFTDGSPTWANPEAHGNKVGTGWVAKVIFSGAVLRP